ncbi:hypothetical protein OG871_21665 [Kitasatospora sp. NBC_00374]|uniref:hypothetical protein n=1 Tax=Kitasatospora sp. NBC_00374 TaxID=2975964 RepID=UPI0030E23B36
MTDASMVGWPAALVPSPVPALGDFRVVAGIEGVMPEVSFGSVPEALEALLTVLDGLTLGEQHRQYLEGRLTGRWAREFIVQRIGSRGDFTLTVRLVDASGRFPRWVDHPLRITARTSGAGR